jgi:hypothetical protein
MNWFWLIIGGALAACMLYFYFYFNPAEADLSERHGRTAAKCNSWTDPEPLVLWQGDEPLRLMAERCIRWKDE